MKTNLASVAPPATNAPAPDPEALRDIVGPVHILNLRELLLYGALAALVLGLAAYLFRVWWRRRQLRLRQGPPPPPPLPPHDRARRRLEDALRFLGEPDRFCTEVSAILREYIEERFGWNAPDRTTEEFLQQLRGRPQLDDAHQSLLQDFLTRCDFVKFARYEPTETELRGLHQSAVRFVNDTVPPPPSAVPPSTSPATAAPAPGPARPTP